MSFLNSNNSEFLSARITQKGRRAIAEGNFVIKYFQVGDSEFDYNFNQFTGTGTTPHEKVLAPMDKDAQVKYPYFVFSGDTQTTYGDPVQQSLTETIKNDMGAAGFVSDYVTYDTEDCTGTTINCTKQEINLNVISGSTSIQLPSDTAVNFNGCQYITILFNNRTVNTIPTLTGNSTSLIYKVTNINEDTDVITIDRATPNFSTLTGYAQVICNSCSVEFDTPTTIAPPCHPNIPDPAMPHDSWNMEIVWTQKPAGLQSTNENLTGYTGTQYASTKEYLGYTSTSGQTFTNFTGGTITGTTYVNSYGEKVFVKPEDQRVIAIIHYSELGDSINDPERFFKYDDYIAHDTDDLDYFQVYIPFLMYHRNTGTTIGAYFTMGTTDYYVTSSKNDKPNTQNVLFRYLLDELGNQVGKVFVGKKLIVFDDQEIIAALDYKSNRKYTLPAPKTSLVPVDLPCSDGESPLLMSGETAYVTYFLEYTNDEALTGLHCNYYSALSGTGLNNISIKFKTGDFRYMNSQSSLTGSTVGYRAKKLVAIVQTVTGNDKPDPSLWIKVDLTSQIPNHTVGDLINPTNLCNHQFVITQEMYDAGSLYNIGSNTSTTDMLDGYQPTTNINDISLPQFGDSAPFPGAVKLTRASDLEVMTFMVNLPSANFTTTQNPTYNTGTKRITEVALLDETKHVLVMAKTAKPVIRSGTQVFAVKLDF
jgi:hypothetical protein